MRNIIGCKVIYVLLVLGNILITTIGFGGPDKNIYLIKLSSAFFIVNGIVLWRFLQKECGPLTLIIERVLSFGRMTMNFAIATVVGMPFAFYSPVLMIFWTPLFKLSEYFKSSIGIFFVPLLCLLLLALEIYYFVLLNRNKDELSRNIPPNPESEDSASA